MQKLGIIKTYRNFKNNFYIVLDIVYDSGILEKVGMKRV